ncbi:MAG: serpin family protein [Kineothrix sp.]
MMRKRSRMAALGILLSLTALFCLTGCGKASGEEKELPEEEKAGPQIQELTAGLKGDTATEEPQAAEGEMEALADFGVRLFQQSLEEGKNTLISPLSAALVLGMAANGARGETLSQMEEVIGLPIDRLNASLYVYRKNLPEGERYQVRTANSVWFREDASLAVEEDFLQAAMDWYDGEVFRAVFDDAAVKAVNDWVSENTHGMIKEIMGEASREAVMYLINALTFEAQWERIYYDHQVSEGVFTREDGTEQAAELMYSEEYSFLEDERATGFMKYYSEGKYAFAALLPHEGTDLSDYASSLTGEGLKKLLAGAQETEVRTRIPRFQCEYSVEMGKILMAMGMTRAFEMENADFSGIGSFKEGNLCISRVLHKTFIQVDTEGTRAGAAALTEVAAGASPTEPKEVYLNRPFLYMIVDCETYTPLFIGAVMDMGN